MPFVHFSRNGLDGDGPEVALAVRFGWIAKDLAKAVVLGEIVADRVFPAAIIALKFDFEIMVPARRFIGDAIL